MYTTWSNNLAKPKRKCRQANKPIYSNRQMQSVNNKIWDNVFPYQCMLKATSWNLTRENTAVKWLKDNLNGDVYRVSPDDSRLVWFKNQEDRNLFLLTHSKHFIQYTIEVKVRKLMLNKS